MKLVSLMLVSLLVCEGAGFAGQAPPTTETSQVQTQETPQAAKIKAKVQKRGTGEKSRVKVKLANGTEVKGYVSKIEETSFTVTDKKTGQTTAVLYADVQKILGPGLSKGGVIALVVVAGVVVVVVAVFLAATSNN
jgi:preprotein translocase subunit SecF